jgi:GTP pyrophosphokinase
MAQFLTHRHAIAFARRAHEGQRRLDGRAYLSHPLAVLQILLSACPDLPQSAYTAALLHDTIEDGQATADEVVEHFGAEVAEIVMALTRHVNEGHGGGRTPCTKEQYLARLLAAHEKHPTVFLIKIADRLHNLETAHFLPAPRRQALVSETVTLYLPALQMQERKQTCYAEGYRRLLSMLEESVQRQATEA